MEGKGYMHAFKYHAIMISSGSIVLVTSVLWYVLIVHMICRQKLRRLEVALIEYRESLEERGIKSSEEIERKVAIHRKRLQSEYGLLDSNEDVSWNSKCLFCKYS